MKTRRKFDEIYKRNAVELTLQGNRTVKIVAKDLGLPTWQLYEWRKPTHDHLLQHLAPTH